MRSVSKEERSLQRNLYHFGLPTVYTEWNSNSN